ncbi:2-hydroxyacid dehydrogenase [Microbacterium sp. JB110]|uniref:2-hydroxyacid dehydrogenase n=1 Tax=Microbacterium sp. JB110 TaxID=2024477 RepID=UPI00097ED2C9|nr:2-hydroxyacid dehydrogenase [Microbacterium sp. JB110]RCS60147.1 hydroxyacid dehydrogenase [Microbacterium sp. JB110]SJM47780.1 D-3-phosphoglycerate dehydrogenase [Frigoribacterium sp. JB110]
MAEHVVVTVPTEHLVADVRRELDPSLDVDVVLWSPDENPPVERADMVVMPYMAKPGSMAEHLAALAPRLVQGQSIGYDDVHAYLPDGLPFANASSVHETATAELTIGLILMAQRQLADFVRQQDRAEWTKSWSRGLADRRVLLLGYGGVGKAIASRLAPFEVEIVPVASSARVEDGVQVHALGELHDLAPTAEILINALPGGDATRHIIDDTVLSALPDDALVVNVGRGTSVDTDALVDHVRRGRIRMASDVFDPEPLPADHPLWSLPGSIVAPHAGGISRAMFTRIARLVAAQAGRLARGEAPTNVVLGG